MSLLRPQGDTFSWCRRVAPLVAFLLSLIGFGSADPLSAQSAPVVSVSGLNPRLNQDRGGCVRAFATAGAEAECFDLLAAHGVPGIRALGKSYAPTFIYNSATATPHPVIRMNVTVPASAGVPSSVSAVLRVDGSSTATATATWTGSSFTPGQPKRISVGYEAQGVDAGVHPYTLEVTSTYGSVNYSTTVSDTLVIVNRAFGPFGAGWWLAGLESVSLFGNSVLWIGSDGSTHAYRPTGTGFGPWVADNSGGVDSIVFVATPGGGWPAYYARKLRSGGGEVRYGTSGMQIATINRMGDTTRFNWSSASNGYGVRLDSISLPRRADFDTHQGFVFGYPSTSSPPTSVVAPGGRTLSIGTNGWQLTSFTDPDTSTESFGYVSGTYRMAYLVDPRGSRTDFVYHATGHLNGATRYGGGSVRTSADAYTGFWSPDVRGYMGSVPLDTMWAYGIINGPRDDVADAKDETDLWTNGQGAPTRITDALNNTTYIYRDDPRFPEAVTRVDAPAAGVPNGYYTTRMVHRAHFTARGTVDTTTVVNPLGDSLNALTTYEYGDARWPDFATKATSPTGLVSLTGYNAKGLREWQQVGTDTLRRVRFAYDTLGRVVSVRSVRAAAAGEAAETMEYTSPLGNLTAVVSPLGIRTTYQQDALGRDTLVTTPADSARDLTGATTGALLYQTQKTRYDAVGRVVQSLTTSPATRYWGGDPRVQTQAVFEVPGQTLTVTNTYDERHDLVAVTRASTPDSARTGPITTRWKFDALGRTVAEIAPDPADSTITVAPHDAGFSRSLRDSTVYDAAGQPVQTLSRRGRWTRMTYDALGRLTRRTTDSLTYAIAVDTVLIPGTVSNRDVWYFPLYSPGLDGARSDTLYRQPVLLPGDTAVFAYDAVGNVLQADNADAKVHRSYYPAGLLRRDSLYIRNYPGPTFGHAYGITHTYDLDGRQVRSENPAQLAAQDPTWGQRAYGYEAATGALVSVSTAYGGVAYDPIASFAYDKDGRLTETDVGATVETQAYDADGRARWMRRTTAGVLAQRDSFAYDVRGKRTHVWSLADSTANAYSGMGALVWSWSKKYSQTNATEEAYAPDALANNYASLSVFHSDTSDFASYERSRPLYQKGTGRLLREDRWESALATGAADNQTASLYDAGGNRWWSMQKRGFTYRGVAAPSWLLERTHAYYGADEKLRILDRRTCVVGQVASGQSWWAGTGSRTDCLPPQWTDRPTWEEYRYDALGRRVLVRTDQTGWACESRCVNGVTRTVWDGDQILAEIRAPITAVEQDTGRMPTGTAFEHGYGQVLYTHGPALDHPLLVTRLGYDSVFPNPVWITPHTNWQGSYDSGELVNADNSGTCKRVSSGWYDNTPAAGETGTNTYGQDGGVTHPDSVTVCVTVDWPAPYQWKSKNERGRGIVGPAAWMGSLIEGGRDLSGQMYMRNRFYDPQSGRFTQEDPIGIAGGLNVYGFGKGDPVTYSDPYGLTAEDDTTPRANVQTADIQLKEGDTYRDRRSGVRIRAAMQSDVHLETDSDGSHHARIHARDGQVVLEDPETSDIATIWPTTVDINQDTGDYTVTGALAVFNIPVAVVTVTGDGLTGDRNMRVCDGLCINLHDVDGPLRQDVLKAAIPCMQLNASCPKQD